jgi:putative membrane protein
MRFAIPFLVVCAALVASVLVLGAFARPPEVGPLPDLTLRDPRGQSFDLSSMNDRIWVASFVSADCIDDCPETMLRLSRLLDGLPDDVPLVTFVVDGAGQWPRRPAPAEDRRDWVICQGNDVDADSEIEVRRLATESLLVPAADLDGLSRRTPSAVIVPVDHRGRPLRTYSIEQGNPGDSDIPVAGAWGDVEFRVTLNRNARREAWLHAVVPLLLFAGVILAWRGLVQIHPICMGLAGVITVVLLGFGFSYSDFAVSVPFRGSGWARPLYFSVLTMHTVLTGLIVVLALTAIYYAARRQIERHTAMTRWLAPAWIGVASSGAVVYYLLSVWFPGA